MIRVAEGEVFWNQIGRNDVLVSFAARPNGKEDVFDPVNFPDIL